jgi:hypothetical protein
VGEAVGEAGLEPAHPFGHRNLNPARLPIPPLAPSATNEVTRRLFDPGRSSLDFL